MIRGWRLARRGYVRKPWHDTCPSCIENARPNRLFPGEGDHYSRRDIAILGGDPSL